jgi:thymidylate kinase
LTEGIHRWLLDHFYPKPDLVIYLDAPAEELFKRKGETTIEYLQMCRESFLNYGKRIANFRQVNALQPLDTVCSEISHHIKQLPASKKPKKTLNSQV